MNRPLNPVPPAPALPPLDTALPPAGTGTRALDLRYLERPPAEHQRPYFPFVAHHLREVLDRPGASVLDIGCANGAFLHHLAGRYPRARLTGIDVLPALVEHAARHVPRASFALGDVGRAETLPAQRYSAVTLLTLHSHFDSLDPWLDHVLDLVEPGGRAMLFGPFNPHPVDVLVRLRQADGEGDGAWLPGWNVHSRAAFADHLAARGLRHRFHDYQPPTSVPRSPNDPLSTRRATLDGAPVLTNGGGLLLPFALLEITV
ncbi:MULTISPECIES: class I SAM-dependent methyltransferase [unclassified Streptomyces]|uniref:class I SAM-dependent methyltransferase n=1 Tax=unclassified Streptomyces TaxID=2593676 RepID=UPI002E1078C0|nr:class I SAM-dependent methyltransferase [Streptomyces sp. NBC_01205]